MATLSSGIMIVQKIAIHYSYHTRAQSKTYTTQKLKKKSISNRYLIIISIFYLFISLFLSPPPDDELLSSGPQYGNYDGVKTLRVSYKLKGLLGISVVSNTQLVLLKEVGCAF